MHHLILCIEAPEIMRGESYDAKVDLWSVGVILYGMTLQYKINCVSVHCSHL